MRDPFKTTTIGLTSPAHSADTIVPSDTDVLPHITRAVYVGGGGNIVVRMHSGDVVTLHNALTGVLYPLRADQIMATGTTATNLVGLY